MQGDDEELTKYTFGDVSIQLSAIKESKEGSFPCPPLLYLLRFLD